MQAGTPGAARPGAESGRALVRHRHAPGRAEGHRPDARRPAARAARHGLQLAVLGAGDADDENFFRWLARNSPGGSRRNRLLRRTRPPHPGRGGFLPDAVAVRACGLTQLYSLRYGTLPWCTPRAASKTRSAIQRRRRPGHRVSSSTRRPIRRSTTRSAGRWHLVRPPEPHHGDARTGHAGALRLGNLGASLSRLYRRALASAGLSGR